MLTSDPTAPPSRTDASRQSRGDRTRLALVGAARRHFQEQGFDGATTGDIARAAGVAEGTLFLHFKSKTGLLLHVMETYYAALVSDLREASRDAVGPSDRLRTLVRFWLGRMRQDWGLVRIFGRHGRFADDAETARAFVDMNRQVTRIFGSVLDDLKAAGSVRSDIPTFLLRDALFGCAEHVLIGMDVTGRERDLDQVADLLCELLSVSPSETRDAVTLEHLDAKLDRLLGAVARRDTATTNTGD